METAMAIFDFLKRKPKEEEVKEEKPKTHKVKTKTAKEKATEAGEPYVNVVQVELDPDDVGNGAFELDWNDIFVARLIKAGFKGKDDAQIVDQWFQSICRNILNENFEQWEANQPVDTRPRRVDRNDIGNGRTEVS
jgi:hypothetical protein